MAHHCPACQSVLYDRRRARCGYCGAQIPESLQFSAAETEVLDRKAAQWDEWRKQREREQAARDEEEKKRRDSAASASLASASATILHPNWIPPAH